MLSLRTALFRPQPLNTLTRQTIRAAHPVHRTSSHNPPTTFARRTFSSGPKSLHNPATYYEDLVRAESRETSIRLAGLIAEQEVRDVLEAAKQMTDGELRTMVEDKVETSEAYEKSKLVSDEDLRARMDRDLEAWALNRRELEMERAGKEYDAAKARIGKG